MNFYRREFKILILCFVACFTSMMNSYSYQIKELEEKQKEDKFQEYNGLKEYYFKELEGKDRGVLFACGISELYDDNITFSKKDKKGDFLTNLIFGLGVRSVGERHKLDVTTDVTGHIFSKNSRLDNFSENFNIDFQNDLLRCGRVALSDDFTHSYEPRSFKDEFGRGNGRYSYYDNNLDLGYTKDVTKCLSTSIRYLNEFYHASRKSISDSQLNKIGIDGKYSLTSGDANALSYGYDFRIRSFDPGPSVYVHTVSSGLRYYMTETLYFNVKYGFNFLHSYQDNSYARPLFAASVEKRPDSLTKIGVFFEKEYSTNAYNSDLFDQWQVDGIFERQILKRISFLLDGFYGKGEYVDSAVTSNLSGVSVVLGYDFKKSIKGVLSYSYSNAWSNNELAGYKKNVVSMGLAMAF